MNNLGKAGVQVAILGGLPGINLKPTKYNFDITAWNWPNIKDSPIFPPLLVENISCSGDKFAALFPARRKFYVDNFIEGTTEFEKTQKKSEDSKDESGGPYISFKPVIADAKSPLVNDLLEDGTFESYKLLQPDQYSSALDTYCGPFWENVSVPNIVEPNDKDFIEKWAKNIGVKINTDALEPQMGISRSLSYISQEVVSSSLYWGVESESFLAQNSPFWVNMKIFQSPGSTENATWFVISMGIDNTEDSYDIYLSLNDKTKIVDYYLGREDKKNNPWVEEFDTDLSKIKDHQSEIEIAVMTVAGRLIVWVNQVPIIYNRIDRSSTGDNAGQFKECKIAPGKIRIYGSCVEARINVCPMTFAPTAIMSLPIPAILKQSGDEVQVEYKGVTNTLAFKGSVCELPQQPDKPDHRYGVDCFEFDSGGDAGKAKPSGIGSHQQGFINFKRASESGMTALPSSDFYILSMTPGMTYLKPNKTSASDAKKNAIRRGGCPYFFGIKGGAEVPESQKIGSPVFVDEDVISVSESSTAPDYFHALTTATITLYNEYGKYNALRYEQYGVTIKWGWNGVFKQTFVGVIVSASTNEQPGKETITLQCEDYMYILKKTPIVNSPFYDGMVAYYAIKDLAERAGIAVVRNDWDPTTTDTDYFLPSGYSFSKPMMRFSSTQTLFDCIINIVKRFEAFVFFDAFGNFHANKLEGGLFSEGASSLAPVNFYSNPDSPLPAEIILDEKNVEYTFDSTSNKICVVTLHRDTRQTILYNRVAQGYEDNLMFKKVFLLDQPALGDLETTRTYAERLGKRIFYPIRKIAFKSVGTTNSTILNVLDFITVDQQEFRLTGLNRTYSADSNEFINEYNAEWLGGK